MTYVATLRNVRFTCEYISGSSSEIRQNDIVRYICVISGNNTRLTHSTENQTGFHTDLSMLYKSYIILPKIRGVFMIRLIAHTIPKTLALRYLPKKGFFRDVLARNDQVGH